MRRLIKALGTAGKRNIIAFTITVVYRRDGTLDIELLRTFLEVERTRHFGKAAAELCITQSAVSARIRQLEQALGMALFTRHRNNIQLTAQGRQLRKHARTIVQAWTRARQETGQEETVTAGLAIGALWDLWTTLLDDWLPRLREHMPTTALHIETGTADSLPRKLLDGVIDVAVLFEPPYLAELEIREMGLLTLSLLATRPGLDAVAATGPDYVMVDWGSAFAQRHAQSFPDMPAPTLRMNLGAQAWRYLQHSEGAAYLPEQLATVEGATRSLYPVADAPVIERAVFAIYRGGTDREEGIREALGWLG